MSTFTTVLSGGILDFENPLPSAIVIEDIATGLSRMPRFCGQTKAFYSVARHSHLVFDIYQKVYPQHGIDDAFGALLHDAHEAYMGDIPTPFKNVLKSRMINGLSVNDLQMLVQDAIDKAIGISVDELTQKEIKRCDYIAQCIEARWLVTDYQFWNSRIIDEFAGEYEAFCLSSNHESDYALFMGSFNQCMRMLNLK